MSNVQVTERYAQALFSLVPPDELFTYAQEFDQAITVLQDDVIRKVFFHPRTTYAQKEKLICALSISPLLERFFLLTVEKQRDRQLPQIAQAFRDLVYDHHQTTVAHITAAIPLSEESLSRITERLQQLSGKTVLPETKVDPNIVGGLVIKMDGQVIDSSIRYSLSRLQQTFSLDS